jgi:hypothetical protein
MLGYSIHLSSPPPHSRYKPDAYLSSPGTNRTHISPSPVQTGRTSFISHPRPPFPRAPAALAPPCARRPYLLRGGATVSGIVERARLGIQGAPRAHRKQRQSAVEKGDEAAHARPAPVPARHCAVRGRG